MYTKCISTFVLVDWNSDTDGDDLHMNVLWLQERLYIWRYPLCMRVHTCMHLCFGSKWHIRECCTCVSYWVIDGEREGWRRIWQSLWALLRQKCPRFKETLGELNRERWHRGGAHERKRRNQPLRGKKHSITGPLAEYTFNIHSNGHWKSVMIMIITINKIIIIRVYSTLVCWLSIRCD